MLETPQPEQTISPPMSRQKNNHSSKLSLQKSSQVKSRPFQDSLSVLRENTDFYEQSLQMLRTMESRGNSAIEEQRQRILLLQQESPRRAVNARGGEQQKIDLIKIRRTEREILRKLKLMESSL